MLLEASWDSFVDEVWVVTVPEPVAKVPSPPPPEAPEPPPRAPSHPRALLFYASAFFPHPPSLAHDAIPYSTDDAFPYSTDDPLLTTLTCSPPTHPPTPFLSLAFALPPPQTRM